MSTSKYHHGNLYAALIDSGLALLRRDGIDALSLRGVAREAGVSPTAPYRHFADKEALLAAIAATGFARLDAALRAADETAFGVAALRAQGVAYVGFAVAEPALFRLMFGPLISATVDTPDPTALLDEAQAAYATLRRRVARLVADSRVEIASLAAWSMVHGLATLLVEGRIDASNPVALAEAITAQFILAANERQ
ncbi:TetR/AcrR family transcriptional regulator [Rhodopila sp.]|uniref:TetR/AcrR family transcriptional regulator n=1 Tax=Rhodopila sp. TaxID=2480087 RepID=UPI003D10B2E7